MAEQAPFWKQDEAFFKGIMWQEGERADLIWKAFERVTTREERAAIKRWVPHDYIKAYFGKIFFVQKASNIPEDKRPMEEWYLEAKEGDDVDALLKQYDQAGTRRYVDGNAYMRAAIRLQRAVEGYNLSRLEGFEGHDTGTAISIDFGSILREQLNTKHPEVSAYARRAGLKGLILGEDHPNLSAVAAYNACIQDTMSELSQMIIRFFDYDNSVPWDYKPWRFSKSDLFEGERGYSVSAHIMSKPDHNGSQHGVGVINVDCNDQGKVVIYAKPKLVQGKANPNLNIDPEGPQPDNFLRFFAERGVNFRGASTYRTNQKG